MNTATESPYIKLLYLLINGKENVANLLDLVEDPVTLLTEQSHKVVLKACIWACDKDKTITSEQFEYFCRCRMVLRRLSMH